MSANPAVASSPVDAILQQIQGRLGPTQSRHAQASPSHFFRPGCEAERPAPPAGQRAGTAPAFVA